jgi:hypothetical protein
MTQEHVHSTQIQELEKQRAQRRRLDEILGRFVRADDIVYSDKGLVEQVFARWQKDREAHLGDPNE